MVITAKRKEKETVGALTRRFSRLIQQSGVLIRAREVRFYRKPENKNKRRRAALRRDTLRRRYEELKKLGKLPDESGTRRGRRY